MPSQNVEEYMEALYRLGAAAKPVGTVALAENLHVVAPSVTTMLKRLVRDGLVTHEPYRGTLLTEAGRTMAVSLLRRHRLSERLLTDMIGLPWEKVHDVACKLEHVITGDLEENVFDALGRPETCPHGYRMDGADSIVDFTLFDMPVGETARVVIVSEESGDFLKYMAEVGLVPGGEVVVVERSPLRDVLTVIVGGQSRTISKDVAGKVWVRVSEELKRKAEDNP